MILGSGKRNMATKRSWEIISGLWPAITQAQHSEKPSILKVVDDMINKVDKNMESPGIVTKVILSMCIHFFFCIYFSANVLRNDFVLGQYYSIILI